MKPRTLPVKRQPVQKSVLKRLSAVTRNHRRQRVAAASAADADYSDSSTKISRALTIIFLFHILAIGAWFFHKRYLDGKEGAPVAETQAAATSEPSRETPVSSSGNRLYKVKAGESYSRIAAAQEVTEQDLRDANSNRELRDGIVLNIPPKRIVAAEPPEVARLRKDSTSTPAPASETPAIAIPQRDLGLVDAVPVDDRAAPQRAILVRPNTAAASTARAGATSASGETYVVKAGDSIWGIANRMKVGQDALMKANGISDPKKLKIGMKLVIPR